jgi:hypothetical protein
MHGYTAGLVSSRPVVRHREPELLIDCEEDRTLRAVLVGMLRELSEATRGDWELASRRPFLVQVLVPYTE